METGEKEQGQDKSKHSSNSSSKHSSSDKHQDKDREKDSEWDQKSKHSASSSSKDLSSNKHQDKDREKGSEWDQKSKHSASSSSKDLSSDKHQDKDREKDSEWDQESKHSASSSSKDLSSDKHQDKDREKDSEWDQKSKHSASSSSKDLSSDNHQDKDREKDSELDQKSKHSASSSSKDLSSDNHQDKDREKDSELDQKSKHSASSSSKDLSSDNHQDKDREKDSELDQKSKHSASSSSKDLSSDNHQDKDREKDSELDQKSKHSASSSSKDLSSDKHQDKDREKDSEWDHTSKCSSSSSSKDLSSDKHQDKDREKDSEWDQKSKHSASSSSKDLSSDKHQDKDREKDSEWDQKSKHSASSSSKDLSSDNHQDKDRDMDSEWDQESKHSSSSESSSMPSSSDSIRKKDYVDADKDERECKERERQELKEKERQERKERERQESKECERQERKEKERKERENSEEVQVSMLAVKSERLSPVKADPPKPLKEELDGEEDSLPLSVQLQQEIVEKTVKCERDEFDDKDDKDVPLFARMEQAKKIKEEEKETPLSDKKHKADESEEEKPVEEKVKQPVKKEMALPKNKAETEEKQEVWKWWEEEKGNSDEKWRFLEHKGPVFAPDYERMPKDVKFYYNGEPMVLSDEAEEVATFYAKMFEHDYTSKASKEVFDSNFFKDWRKMMTAEESEKIKDLKKCDFRDMCEFFKLELEKRKNRTEKERLILKEENAWLQEYGFCIMDGHKEKIGNFKIEPPGLFRGRGDHPKMGMLKRRVLPEDVTWLASWNENIQGQRKYVMLNAASRLKGEIDWQKYETARRLHKCVDKIRANYQEDWKAREMRIRQRAVAMYFIDKLAMRAGNIKKEGETADTVGCCSLRVEHITLHAEKDGKQNVVEFDFLGMDSIRYQNAVPVEKRVFKNLQMFMDNKQPGDDLFDRLNTFILNKHLHDLMEGLTAKVFRTYNASKTLQEQLDLMTNEEDPVPAKMLSYDRANRAVAILCNHQHAAPKNFSKQMENIMAKIKDKRAQVKESKKQLKDAKAAFKSAKNQKSKIVYEEKKKAYERMKEQLTKLEVQATVKDENKEIALGTSKLYLSDPRISVAWCKKWGVPVEEVYNKTQRDKFRWAIDMAEADFRF